jgi:uncharacterized delta-60 repeat protein
MTTNKAGIITTTIGTGNDAANSAILQPNGKIIAAGHSYNATDDDFALVRYNKNGSLDKTFGIDGKLTTAISSFNEAINSVALQADGKILVAGYSYNSTDNNDFTLARYNPDGSLDTSFDFDGKVTTAFAGFKESAWSVFPQADGKIITAGWSTVSTDNNDFALARYNADGSLDSSFDFDGKVTTPIGSSNDAGYRATLQADGKIVVAGRSWNGTKIDFALIRYNTDGSLDSTFDGDGKVTTAMGSVEDIIRSVITQLDGKIVVAGYSKNATDYDFALARYNTDGSLDSTFDGDGKLTTAIGSGNDQAFSMVLQSDGKILVAGYSTNATDADFALVRYNANGSLDTSFDGDGKLILAIGAAANSQKNGLVLQPDGKIVVTGVTNNGTDNDDIAVVRFNPDGSLDTTFDGKEITNSLLTGTIQISGNAIQNETLSIQNTLNDADGLSASTPLFRYQWLQNGIAISGATQATYTLSENDIGTEITVKVSYTDGLGKLETATSNATDLIQPFSPPDFSVFEPTYNLTVDKTTANEGEKVTFKLSTTNLAVDTEIPFKFSGSISAADVLGGLKTTRFVVDANGNATLPLQFLADKFTDGKTENLTMTLNNGANQSVTVKDTSLTPVPVVKPVVNNPTSTTKPDFLGTSSNDKVNGTENSEFFSGVAGNDVFLGMAGNDTLDGGTGNDSLNGGNGNDVLLGGEGNDTLIGGSDNDKINGGKGNDLLTGDKGKDTLDGGEGADIMDGGEGDDYYYSDNVKDSVKETNKDPKIGGNDTVESKLTYTLGDNVENLVLVGGNEINGTGNKLNNRIEGNAVNNFLNGGVGNDTLIGNDGDDTLDGGAGVDRLEGGKGSDTYKMNNTEDKIIETPNKDDQDQVIAAVDYDLSESPDIEMLTLEGIKAIRGIGNDSDNSLQEKSGGKVANFLDGQGGNDSISGEGGDDTLIGGDGNDTLDGGEGNDVAVYENPQESYQLLLNTDVNPPQITVRYTQFGDVKFGEEDVLDSIEFVQFSDGVKHNINDVIDITASSSSTMLILNGIEMQ